MTFISKIKRILKKGFRYLKRYGFFKTFKKVLKTIYFRLKFKISPPQVNYFSQAIDLSKYSTVIVFENNFGWNKIMKQRPQQIAENLPEDVLMFYHSHEDNDFEKGQRIRYIKDNLVLVDLGYFRDMVFEFLANHYNKYLMVYSTDFIPYERIDLYKDYRYKVIYEYVDDLNEELSGEAYNDLLERHEKVMADEDAFVVSTATRLKESVESASDKEVALVTNGVDYEQFRFDSFEMPSDLAPIRKKYKVLLCYYGALAGWFDYDLVRKISENKDYALVLIGQDYDNTLSKSGILEIDNVFFLGRKNYGELRNYGCNMDICIIPFVVNDITLATSPVKLFEYMAMEKPIVTTALPECKKYKSVFYSETSEDFISNLEKAVSKIGDEEYKALLVKEALENTWQSKAADLVRFVNLQKAYLVKKPFEKILKECEYSRIVLWRSPFGWNVPLFQRPQHIARQLAKQGCLVFYEVTPKTDVVDSIKEVEPNLYLVNYENYSAKTLLEEAISLQDKPSYVQLYSTNWSMGLEELESYFAKGFRLLYEYIDDISPDLAGTEEIPQYILDKYEYAMGHKEVPVVTTARQIFEDVARKRGEENMVLSCNGVDYDFFQDFSKDFPLEEDFQKIISNGKINVCYYGALATWFDYDLIYKIDKTGLYNIILIGVKYDASYDNSGIDSLENVYFIGPRNYDVLKYYARCMDILTIPFVINSITQATSPLKLFEYMALHKPIVTTAMLECKNYKSVLAASSHEEFISFLEKATEMKENPEYMELLDKEARENDWSKKAELIIKLLKENEKEKAREN